jgi:hypothetical protein
MRASIQSYLCSTLAALLLGANGGCASTGPAREPSRIEDPADQQIDERVQRRVECDALIDRINAELDAIKENTEAAKRTGPNEIHILQISHLYEKLAGSIADLELTDEELSKLADRYQLMARRVSRAAREIAEAAAAEDTKAFDRAQSSFERLTGEEQRLTEAINDVCDRQTDEKPKQWVMRETP